MGSSLSPAAGRPSPVSLKRTQRGPRDWAERAELGGVSALGAEQTRPRWESRAAALTGPAALG